jgi:hypothetical protein
MTTYCPAAPTIFIGWPRTGNPDRTRLALSVIGIDRRNTGRLGETVALQDADLEATLERLEQLP